MHFTSALLASLPLAMAGPVPRNNEPSCQSVSSSLEWKVEDFDFHASYTFSTPAHQNSWGYVNFNLSNPALDYQASCHAASSQLSDFFYGNMAYQCDFPEDVENPGEASFNFSRPNNMLDITQKWTCYDDPKYPATFTALGNVTLNLDCQEETYKNPDWKIGQIYSSRTISCGKVNSEVKPNQIMAVA